MTNATGDPPVAVLAVDGGNSKVDLALVTRDGAVLAALRGPTVSHQAQAGLRRAIASFRETLDEAIRRAGISRSRDVPLAEVAVLSVAGADTRRDIRLLRRGFGALDLGRRLIITNDGFGALRAGTQDGVGVAVICGTGSNVVAIGPSGRVVRFPALGEIAGDLGGGGWLGPEGLSAALRGRDGRGPSTSLERLVPAFFGLRRPLDVTYALYEGRIESDSLRELAPLVFKAAVDGDPVARRIVDRQTDEVVAMAVAALRRVRGLRAAVPVVLAGSIFRADDPAFHARIAARLAELAPRAEIRRLTVPPVVGAALLGLDELGVGHATKDRLRSELVDAAVVRVGGLA